MEIIEVIEIPPISIISINSNGGNPWIRLREQHDFIISVTLDN